MRIALISHSESPWTPHYARHFTDRGHDVLVVSFHPGSVGGVRTIDLAGGRSADEVPKRLYLTRSPRVARILRRFAPDVVFATYVISNGVAAALSWRGPFLVSARGGDVLDQPGNPPIPRWLRRLMIRFVCARAGRVHAVSEEIAEALREHGVRAEKILCFPMGVDVERFRPAEGPATMSDPPRLVCTRAHYPVYRNEVIVEAVARLRATGRRLRCTFAGRGPLLKERQDQVARLGLTDTVTFLADEPHERMPDRIRSADVYVSASSSDGTSSSLLEALACGLVPVVSRIRANTSWVRDGETGFLFAVGDAADLAQAVARALDGPEVRARARSLNPRLVRERGDQKRNSERLLQTLEELAGHEAVRR